MNILLTGSQGYIGSGIIRYLDNRYNISKINRRVFDLRDTQATDQWFNQLDHNTFFDVVIHTAIVGGNRLSNDDSSVLDNNIKMYSNLLNHRDKYRKFINIGSGAEKCSPDTFYGLSKKTIACSLSDKKHCYNLRIYGIFDEYEIDRRFIKSSLSRYLNQQNIVIHNDRYMDFIYFLDFISILRKYIENDDMPKTLDCVYRNKYMLTDIAAIINQLDYYTVKVEINDKKDTTDYIGECSNLQIDHHGLEYGIKETYKRIKNEKNMVCPK